MDEMSDRERIALLEQRLASYDQLLIKLITYAKLTKGGRMLLKVVGL